MSSETMTQLKAQLAQAGEDKSRKVAHVKTTISTGPKRDPSLQKVDDAKRRMDDRRRKMESLKKAKLRAQRNSRVSSRVSSRSSRKVPSRKVPSRKVPSRKVPSRKESRKSDGKPSSKSDGKSSSKSEGKSSKYLVKASEITKYLKFSGTIIYSGTNGLDPTSWNPMDSANSPSGYQWSQLMPGTHILDQVTCLTWIVNISDEGTGTLELGPCQVLRLDISTPPSVENGFDTRLVKQPRLPPLEKIPVGTQFYFRDSSQGYLLVKGVENDVLRKLGSAARPSQVIPIPINSLYHTENLVGLGEPIEKSNLQRLTRDGYKNLNEWLAGLIPGDDRVPGFLGSLPSLEQLQVNDLLEFYDPNTNPNPKMNGKNPNGTPYVSEVNESRYFKFRMRITESQHGKLMGKVIESSAAVDQIEEDHRNISIIESLGQKADYYLLPKLLKIKPIELGNSEKMSESLKSLYPNSSVNFGDNLITLQDVDRVCCSVTAGNQLIVNASHAQGDSQEFAVKWNWNLHRLTLSSITIDGMGVDFVGNDFKIESEVIRFIQAINQGLTQWGYPNASVSWFSNKIKDNNWSITMILRGVTDGKLPTIGFNVNGKPTCPRFR